jgi:hypothetical protein
MINIRVHIYIYIYNLDWLQKGNELNWVAYGIAGRPHNLINILIFFLLRLSYQRGLLRRIFNWNDK